MARAPQHKDVRTPKYRPRVIPDKRKQQARNACRKQENAKCKS